MTQKKEKSFKNLKLLIFLILLFILFGFVLLFTKSKFSKNQSTKEASNIPALTSNEENKEINWKVYENKHIYFKHPENKIVHDIFGGPAEESKSFELYGKTGQRTMEISIFSIPEDTNQVFGGELSTKVIAEKSRVNKISSDGGKDVLNIKETSLNDLSGYYYDFSSNYSAPYGQGAGFVTDNNCSNYRAVFLNGKKELMTVIYCLEEPYATIFNSIRLK